MEELEAQLNELDALHAIYSGKDELVLDNPLDIVNMRSAVEQQTSTSAEDLSMLGSVGFTMSLYTPQRHKVEISIVLPGRYPITAPNVSVRCSDWSRTQHSRFTDALSETIKSDIHREGTPCLHDIICWVLDNTNLYIADSVAEAKKSSSTDASNKSHHPTTRNRTRFSRLWIYSHHIYNLTKRKMIVDTARELDLTGFCVPGKPGIICVEGDSESADSFWFKVKSYTWQRITVRHREDGVKMDRKFEGFEERGMEKTLDAMKPVKGRGAHADLGEVYQYLQQRGCGDVFRKYFGSMGKEAVDNNNSES